MLMKTHLAIGAFAALFFLPHVQSKLIFVSVALIASALPDIDSAFSTVGKKKIFRVLQVFTKHRGFFHSFTFCVALALFFAFFIPVLAFPFFLGYGLHLFADSFSVQGIRPFWPLKAVSGWKVKVGGPVDQTLFLVFAILDVVMLVFVFV